jgi:hypothetical protein
MIIGLSAKLKPHEVVQYKQSWEQRCRDDIRALSRDRLSYYVTLYKNPPRIREAILKLRDETREDAVRGVMQSLADEHDAKMLDKGFDWQTVPKKNELTFHLLAAAFHGETWPPMLHRVGGHPEDPDLPVDLSPPHGMTAFHAYDSYCQILVQVLAAATQPIPLDDLYTLRVPTSINSYVGSLVMFEETGIGTNVRSPRAWRESPTARFDLEAKRGRTVFRTRMRLKTMYVFSDTSAENLERCRVRGIGILGGAIQECAGQVELQIVPLLVGMGGLGQSDPSGWGWKAGFGPRP